MKSQSNIPRRPAPKLLACALASCLAVAAPAALAQSTGATLRGQVTVDSAPAADAQITATNVATGYTRRVQAANGSYNLGGLPPGTYRIDAVANGQTTTKTVTLAVGQTATLNLSAGGVSETGPVERCDHGGNGHRHWRSARGGEDVRDRDLREQQADRHRCRRASRNFLSFADLAPGVAFRSAVAKARPASRSGAQLRQWHQRLHRRRRPEGLRAARRHQRPGFEPRQSVPAVGDRRVQGHHPELQGRVRPAQQRGHRRDHALGHQRVRGELLLGLHHRRTGARRTVFEERAGRRRSQTRRRRSTARPSAARSCATRRTSSWPTRPRSSTAPRSLDLGRDYEISRHCRLRCRKTAGTGLFVAPFKEDLYFAKIDWLIGEDHYFEFTAQVPRRGAS